MKLFRVSILLTVTFLIPAFAHAETSTKSVMAACKKNAGEAEFASAVGLLGRSFKTDLKNAKTKEERELAVGTRNSAIKKARQARLDAKKLCK